jgi:acylglycerol lipase
MHRESWFAGARRVRIYWQAWLPATAPRALIVIAHGASEHSGRYAHVAARLVDEGYAVYALEHRGHGRSQGPRALIDRMGNAVADVDRLVALAAAEHPRAKVFLLGHSMGATIALCYALRHQQRLSGLILTGPLAALESAPLPMRIMVKLLSAVAPTRPVVAIDPSLVSRDQSVVKAYVDDPLVYHGMLPARTVAELATAIDSFPDRVQAITVSTLVMYGTADRLCPPRGSGMLGERLGAADKTLRAYGGLYHEILNEPEQDQVLDEICSWLAARAGSVAPSRRPTDRAPVTL